MVRHKLPPPAPEREQPPFPTIVGKHETKPHVAGQQDQHHPFSSTSHTSEISTSTNLQKTAKHATSAECIVVLDGEPVLVKAKVDQKTGLVKQATIKSKDQDEDELPFKVTPIQVPSASQASLLTKEPKLPQATPLAAVIGPLLHFRTTDPSETRWYGSILMVVANVSQAPVITLEDPIVGDETTKHKTLVPRLLERSWEYVFYRYDIDLPIQEKERRIQYRVVKLLNMPEDETETEYFGFWIPGKGQTWRWAFWSCSGFDYTADPKLLGGHEPVWKDLVLRHSQLPLHAMVGGGDQVYMDGVFTEVEELALWLNVKERQTAPFTSGIRNGAERYYLEAYCRAFSSSVIREALASIPSIMVIDDHDIFDGYGSYRDKIQESPVLSGVGKIAFRMYRLFQLHTTLDHFEDDGIFGHGTSGSFLSRFGSDMLVLGYDSRSERSIDQIASPESYEIMFAKLQEALEHPAQPRAIKHLAVLLSVPIVYPKFEGVEKLLRTYATVKKHTFGRIMKLLRAKSTREGKNLLHGLQKRGIFRHLLTQMDHVELADDLADHWTAPHHRRERVELIQRLQAIALKYSVRITFFSGDVHLAALGLLHSSPQGCLETSNTTLAGWCDFAGSGDSGSEKSGSNFSGQNWSEPDLHRNSADVKEPEVKHAQTLVDLTENVNNEPDHIGKNSAEAEVEHALSLVDLNPVIKTVKKKGDSNTNETSTNHAKYGSLTKRRDHAPLPPQITSYTHAPSRDPRWMAQITSSAIVNASPPQAVVKYLHMKSKTCLLDDFTVEKMVKIFKEDTDNRPLKINEVLARRNYATVEPDGGTGGLVIKLRMEISPGKGQTKAFSVPSLEVEREEGKVVEW